MKNLLFGLVAFMTLSFTLNAQNYADPIRTFGKGQTDIQVGVGLLSTSAIMDNATSKFPSMSLRASRFLGENFSLGVSYSLSSSEGEPMIVGDGFSQKITNTTHAVAVRPAFHFTKIKRADMYGGVQIGMNFEKFEVDQGDFEYLRRHMGIQPQQTKVTYSAYIGGRYALSKRFSTFGEIGFGASLLNVGFGYRI